MCGIAGWLSPPESNVETLDAAVGRMVATLVHRGPDDNGRWVDAPAGIALGYRRLSVLDLSQAGRQPMLSADGRYACVFNGEIYNHRDLRAELVQKASPTSRSRPESLILVSLRRASVAPSVMLL